MRLAPFAVLAAFAALPASADGIVPLDGTWTTRATDGAMSEGCSDALREMIQPMFDAMMANTEQEQIAWGGVFDPASMVDGPQEGLAWERAGENAWRGEVAVDQDRPPAMTFSMEAVSETRIVGEMSMDVAALVGGEMADPDGNPIDPAGCSVAIETETTHSG